MRRAAGRAGALVFGLAEVGVGAASGYLAFLTASAWRAEAMGEARTFLPEEPTHRFVVLIPAHNEEDLIGATLKTLGGLDYPEHLVAVHVVADNCTDATAEIARSHGAEVHEHDDPANRGKGPALTWLMRRLEERGERFDAAVFVDADTSVNPAFLRVCDARLAGGAVALQAHYAVREPGAAPAIAFRAAALAARHYLRPLGRTALGGSAGLFGNGMVFRADTLRGLQWSRHLTEDIELHLQLLLDGERVGFAPDAVVEAEMPATLEASRSQHQRWERGRVQVARRYVPALLRRGLTGRPPGRLAAVDAALDQAVPPFSVLVAATAALGTASAGRALLRPSPKARRSLVRCGLLALAQAFYVLSALRMVGAPRSVYRSLLAAPRLVAWKVGLWLRVLVRPGEAAWVRTQRNQEASSP